MARKPIDRSSFASRLATANQNLELIQATLAEVALKADNEPDDIALLEQLAELKRQRDKAKEVIENLELAKEGAAHLDVVLDAADKQARIAELKRRIDTLHKTSTVSAVKIINSLEQLGPKYSALVADLAELRELTAAAVRIAGGAKGVQRVMGGGRYLDGHDCLAASVSTAIVSAGFGLVGPSLGPIVTVVPPSGAFRVEDIETAFNRLQEMRLDCIEQAGRPSTMKVEA